MSTVAVLFADPRGTYSNVDGVDIWGEDRDARLYDGPYPVVAHPPCARWCRLAGLVEARWGYKRGEDGGCFASALKSIRTHGGVLEHPAYTDAWAAHGLNRPPTGGKWVNADLVGGWTCYVEQSRYGHPAKKATWIYAHGVELLDLKWGHVHDSKVSVPVSWCGNHIKSGDVRRRLSSKEASSTPPEFRDLLLSMARTARRKQT